MRVRRLALTVAAAPLLAVTVGLGAPALAAGSDCGAYPPGSAYGLRASTNHVADRYVTVRRGASVMLTARVFRNGVNCSGRRVDFFVHGPGEFSNGQAAYHYSGSATTDSNGIAVLTKTVVNDFRWYAGYTSDNGTGVVNTRGADRDVIAG
ncbi:MAG: hypothetical protein NVS3B26_29460 [Mycobacteriales bacterium]